MKRSFQILALVIFTLFFASCTPKAHKCTVRFLAPNNSGILDTTTYIFTLEDQYTAGTKVNMVLLERYENKGVDDNRNPIWEKTGRDYQLTPVPVNLDSSPDYDGNKRIANYTGIVQ